LLLRPLPRYSRWRNYKWGLANPSLVPHALAVVLCNRLSGPTLSPQADRSTASAPRLFCFANIWSDRRQTEPTTFL
jgi:hypothetical protein